jgi:molybdopterin-synthase adenylyltransferase
MDQHAVESERRLRLNRLQVVETGEGLLLKRGRVVVEIQGAPSAQIAQALLQISANGDATRQELCAPFPPELHPSIEALIEALEARRLLTDAARPELAVEEPVDVFYWHFGRQREDVARSFTRVRVTVLGVNCVSRRLVSALRESGIDDVEVVDYPLLANVRLFRESGQVDEEEWPERFGRPTPYREWLEAGGGRENGCLVGTSDFGGQHLLRSWNQHCVRERVQFLPVVLQDLIGTIGPLVVPGESACLECFRARENAHMDMPEKRRASEYGAFQGQVVNAFHPSMASVLGDLVAMELVKFHGQLMRSQLVGNLIEINLLVPEITTRRVLKLPRCQVCGTLVSRSPVSDDKIAFMPGHEVMT